MKCAVRTPLMARNYYYRMVEWSSFKCNSRDGWKVIAQQRQTKHHGESRCDDTGTQKQTTLCLWSLSMWIPIGNQTKSCFEAQTTVEEFVWLRFVMWWVMPPVCCQSRDPKLKNSDTSIGRIQVRLRMIFVISMESKWAGWGDANTSTPHNESFGLHFRSRIGHVRSSQLHQLIEYRLTFFQTRLTANNRNSKYNECITACWVGVNSAFFAFSSIKSFSVGTVWQVTNAFHWNGFSMESAGDRANIYKKFWSFFFHPLFHSNNKMHVRETRKRMTLFNISWENEPIIMKNEYRICVSHSRLRIAYYQYSTELQFFCSPTIDAACDIILSSLEKELKLKTIREKIHKSWKHFGWYEVVACAKRVSVVPFCGRLTFN